MAFVRGRRDETPAPIIFDSGTSPRDRPLPSSHSSSKCVSFPNAKVREILDKAWAKRCEYADHVTVLKQDILPPHGDTSSFSKEAEVVTSDIIEVSQMSPHSLPPIWARLYPSWQLRFFIRVDFAGRFHTYPDVGGPFQSVHDANNAISRHLDELRSPEMCTDGLSRSEICIRNTLYWPDGTRKKSSKYSPGRRNMVALVHSLLDKYNEDHNLFSDLAYELEDVVSSGEIYERGSRSHMFYHINFTTKRQTADGDNLFFAEVTCLMGENEEYVLNCFCAVKPNDKGRCHGCENNGSVLFQENNGSVDLNHPTDSRKYKGGHSIPYPRCSGFDLPWEILDDIYAYDDEEARLAAEESRIRRIYKCLDDEVLLAKLDGARGAGLADSS